MINERILPWCAWLGAALLLAGCDQQRGRVVVHQDPAAPLPESEARLFAQLEEHEPAYPTDPQEADLVERVVSTRGHYHDALRALRDYYAAHGYHTKTRWADTELAGVQRVQPFRYLLDAEVPPANLRATEAIAEADALFEEGKSLMRRGGHGVPGVRRQEHLLEAIQTFRTLIEQYPSSDKIDDAAFEIAEIYRHQFRGQERLAVQWYERAWTWDPQTPYPARYNAAVLYDYRLLDRQRALELYQNVVSNETASSLNVRLASRRIDELSRQPARP